VEVTDEEVQQRWDYQLSQLVKRYGSEARIEAIYGMSIAKIQNDYRDDIRKMLLTEKIRRNQFGEISVSPREVDEFFAQFKDTLPMVPTRVELFHIVKNVQASKNSKERVYDLANSIRDSIIKGGDFADFAKRYSADPGSASSGGDLGWTEKGKLFKEFELAAFNLQIGQISRPVETPFGYHIIQTLNKNKDSVYARHILFRTGQNNEERDSARAFLLDIKRRVLAGESFEDLARKYSDEKESQGFGGSLGKYPLDMIPGNIREEIDKIAVGGVSDPSQFNAEPQMSFHIIYKKRIIEQHKANMTDDLKEIQQYATQNKQQKLYTKWVEDLRKTIYWEVKE
jgi:peptidyl-prolyl cis-trans isomerase SurA